MTPSIFSGRVPVIVSGGWNVTPVQGPGYSDHILCNHEGAILVRCVSYSHLGERYQYTEGKKDEREDQKGDSNLQ